MDAGQKKNTRFNLANSTSQEYAQLFKLVSEGKDIPVLVFSTGVRMHDIAMCRMKDFEIDISARGTCYNSISIEKDTLKENIETIERDFIKMCEESSVYFFDK